MNPPLISFSSAVMDMVNFDFLWKGFLQHWSLKKQLVQILCTWIFSRNVFADSWFYAFTLWNVFQERSLYVVPRCQFAFVNTYRTHLPCIIYTAFIYKILLYIRFPLSHADLISNDKSNPLSPNATWNALQCCAKIEVGGMLNSRLQVLSKPLRRHC